MAGALAEHFGAIEGASIDANKGAYSSAWMIIFGVIAAIMVLIGIYHIKMLPSTQVPSTTKKTASEVGHELVAVIANFFTKKHILYYICFIILYRLAEGFIMKIAPLFLRASRDVVAKIRQFAEVAKAISYSKSLKVASFGNNMREVAVTDGDRVESQIKYGWECNYFALGDVVDTINAVTEEEIDAKMKEYTDKYTMKTDRIDSVREQAKYEVGLEKFLAANGIGAFADTFQDLHGLKQLPGIAAQNLMAKGIGFGPEGDYKISALSAVLMKMSEGRDGATGFIEDYTYDLTPGQELELASHMLEVPPAFAATKPEIDVLPLGIGGKEDPARLIFDGVTGDGIQVTMVDMGDHFRLICADIELVKQPKPMPNLPVARIMYRHKPNFQIGTAAWCYAGGAHHSVVSTALTRDDIAMFARLTGTELITIGEDTTEADLQKFFMK